MSSLDIVQRYASCISFNCEGSPQKFGHRTIVLGVALMTGMLKKVGHDTLAWVYYPVHDRTGAEIHTYP